MTTKTSLAIVLLFLATILPTGRNASANPTGNDTLTSNYTMMSLPAAEDEGYVDDIPFDTKVIALESLYLNMVEPEEESYINDIPFETEKIASLSQLLKIRPEVESYINDIPFNTSEIAKEFNYNCSKFAATGGVECEE